MGFRIISVIAEINLKRNPINAKINILYRYTPNIDIIACNACVYVWVCECVCACVFV